MADVSVKKVNDTIRWVRGSPARLLMFKKLASLLGVEEKSSLCLDVPTRWNSTYLILNTAIPYRSVFEVYEGHDVTFKRELGDSIPVADDWNYLQSFITILKVFYEMTLRISGSLYITSNSYLTEISDLSCIIADMMASQNSTEQNMGKIMKEKFQKYWGDPDKMNMVIFFANILDPKDKVEYMPLQFNQLYGEDKGDDYFEKVKYKLTSLFEAYVAEHSSSESQPSNVQPPPKKCVPIGRVQSRLKSQLKKQKLENGTSENKKSEIEIYLGEAIVDDSDDFDVLRWWKVNSERFSILSNMTRDLLAVPISTVVSESTFSTSGRVLDNFRSSLTPKIVQALVCTQD